MIVAIVQARMGSSRLPGKVMKAVLGKPLIGFLMERLKRAREIDGIVLATSISPENASLCQYVKSLGIAVYRGSEEDVLDRFYQTAKVHGAESIVRITADCPLLDHHVLDKVVRFYKDNAVDYVSNGCPPTYPDGLDVDVFSFQALSEAWSNAQKASEREHVTPYMKNNPSCRFRNVEHAIDLSSERWTVDEPEDFQLVQSIIENLYPKNNDFGLEDIMEYKRLNPALFQVNAKIKRNEGYEKSLREDFLMKR